jgi:uncharacterized protein YndB with AHSA1/START domain
MTAPLDAAASPIHELVLTRVYDAPRALVFKAWTNPEYVAQWWGPKGFTNPVCRWDARPGGEIYVDMRAPDGFVNPMKGTFLDVVEPERLAFRCVAHENEQGEPGVDVVHTITLIEQDGKTTLTLHSAVLSILPEIAFALDGDMERGWNSSLDKLGETLARASSMA